MNRTLEHFYFWHCVDELRAARLLPPGYPIGGVSAYGNLMSPYWSGAIAGRSRPNPFYFQANERLPQYLTEEVLRSRAADLPSVTFLFERTANVIEQDDNGVRVTVSSQVWPYEDEVIEADYAVGCDGARSFVRDTLGIERHGTDFDTRMVLAVFSSPELHAGLERLGDRTTYRVVNPDLKGAWQFFGRVEVGLSWFFHAPVAKDTTADDHEYIHGLMEQAAGFSFPVEFEHIGFWNLRIDVADTYRKERIFIAGDAAHGHPPYGGQGLNNGLEDVTNLGWKLAAKLSGWGGEALLDSYSQERQVVFAEIGEDIIAGGIKREAKWLELHSPERDRADFEEAWKQRTAGGSEQDRPQQGDIDPNYEGSPVVFGPPDGRTGVHSTLELKARAGHHLAPQPLSSGRNVYEELGTGFTLLALDADDQSVKAFAHAAESAGVPLTILSDTFAGGRENYGSRLVLIRPDQFVAWTGDDAPSADLIIRKVVGRQ